MQDKKMSRVNGLKRRNALVCPEQDKSFNPFFCVSYLGGFQRGERRRRLLCLDRPARTAKRLIGNPLLIVSLFDSALSSWSASSGFVSILLLGLAFKKGTGGTPGSSKRWWRCENVARGVKFQAHPFFTAFRLDGMKGFCLIGSFGGGGRLP